MVVLDNFRHQNCKNSFNLCYFNLCNMVTFFTAYMFKKHFDMCICTEQIQKNNKQLSCI